MSFERVTGELHQRRFSRNLGVALCLAFLIVLLFALTAAKITQLGHTEGFDHTVRPSIVPQDGS